VEKRYAGHIVVAYILTAFVIYMARREMLHFVHMRHQFLVSKAHSKHAQARTVLLTSVPDDLASDHDLREFASFVPGGIEKTWIYRDTKVRPHLFTLWRYLQIPEIYLRNSMNSSKSVRKPARSSSLPFPQSCAPRLRHGTPSNLRIAMR
jgi:hypothetical protein